MYSDRNSEINKCIEDIKCCRSVEAITQLHTLVGSSIRYIALKYLKNELDAGDLVQDFWADIYEVADGYRYLSNGFNYLCKVMTNKAINRYRKLTKQKEFVIKYVPYEEYDSKTEIEVDNDIDNRQLVYKAMSPLNDQEKLIIQETYFLGKTAREIADEIGISKSYVNKIKKHAMHIMLDAIASDKFD